LRRSPLIKIAAHAAYIEVIMKRKLFFILTTIVLLIATACSGSFIDPGIMDQPGRGGGGGNFGGSDNSDGGDNKSDNSGVGNEKVKLAAPSNVTASAQSSHSIRISWSAVSKASRYYVYRSTSANGTYTRISDTSSIYYTDNKLKADTTYYYNVSASNNEGESDKSSTSAKTSSPGDAEKNPITLTENKWAEGDITSGAAEKEIWYSFDVKNGTKYYVWWNDRSSGDTKKTLNVSVDAYYSNDSSIFYGIDSGWSTAQSFTANSTGKVKLRVYPFTSGNTGTFAVAYSTSDTRPTPYTVTFDSNGGSGTPPASQTVNTGSSIILPDGSSLSKSGCTFAGWSTAASGGTYYKKGDSYTVNNNIILYAVWISALTGNGTKASPFQLNVNAWADGIITSNTTNKEIWYSFTVTQDTTYYVWWNDGRGGDDSKTLAIIVSAYYSDDSNIFENTVNAFNSPRSFTASSNDTIKIKVQPDSNNSVGTFAIVFSQSSTRP